MKKRKYQKKLSLGKYTVVNLNQMSEIKAGELISIELPATCMWPGESCDMYNTLFDKPQCIPYDTSEYVSCYSIQPGCGGCQETD